MLVKDVRVKVAGKIYPIESETILIIAIIALADPGGCTWCLFRFGY